MLTNNCSELITYACVCLDACLDFFTFLSPFFFLGVSTILLLEAVSQSHCTFCTFSTYNISVIRDTCVMYVINKCFLLCVYHSAELFKIFGRLFKSYTILRDFCEILVQICAFS